MPLELGSFQGGVRLDGGDGLVEAADFHVFIFKALQILQRNLGAPDFPEDEIQVEEENS